MSKPKFTDNEIELIKSLCPDSLTANEFDLFLMECVRRDLDPMQKQIYALKSDYKSNAKMMTIVGIDGFRIIAERTGRYSPGRDTEFLYDKQGKAAGAKVFVKKMTPDGTWHEVSATAFTSEYCKGNQMWKKMPHVMLEKVAESRCLRRCFPNELSGLYTNDEISQEIDITEREPKRIEEAKPVPLDPTRLNAIVQSCEETPGFEDRILSELGLVDLMQITDNDMPVIRKIFKEVCHARDLERNNAT